MSPVIDAVATHGRARPAALAMVDLESGKRWTYAELDREVDSTAAWLVETLGPASGERVATVARNSGNMIILQHACVRAGAMFVPLSWRLTEAEIATLIGEAQPRLVFHDQEFASLALPAGHVSAALDHLPIGNAPAPPPAARRDFDAPATILFTSGTSGKPKGVMITEANATWGSINFILGNGVTQDSVFLCDMPLFHTAGLFANSRTPILAGGVLLISSAFDATRTLERFADPALGISHYFSVPQMARALWDVDGFDPDMLGNLKVYAMGGAPNPAAQIERFVRAGIPMSDGFGMSETCSNFGMPVEDQSILLSKAGSCGLPYLTVQARIVDDDGVDVADDRVGELWLSGPTISPGYWNDLALSAAAFRDGWYRTGDAARRDPDGYYYIVDRRKDMYISGGENIYPAEIESVLARLEGIAQSAVIGVPDDRWGEVGCAYVVTAPGIRLSVEAILGHCKDHLAGYKIPRTIVVVDTLPRTASGKVMKHVLRKER